MRLKGLKIFLWVVVVNIFHYALATNHLQSLHEQDNLSLSNKMAIATSALRLIPSEIKTILDRGELIVALTSVDYSPFHMLDKEGNLIGLDIEIANEIAFQLGVKVKFDRSQPTFDDVVEYVANGYADLGISKLSYTPQRALKVLYSVPYITLHKAFLINRVRLAQQPGTPSLEELFSKKENLVGALATTSYAQFIQNSFPQAVVKLHTKWDDIQHELSSGKYIAGFRDDCELTKMLLKHPELNFNFLTVIMKGEEDPIYIVAPLENTALITWVNNLLNNTKKLHFKLNESLKKYKENL